jgi:hypothetical protein
MAICDALNIVSSSSKVPPAHGTHAPPGICAAYVQLVVLHLIELEWNRLPLLQERIRAHAQDEVLRVYLLCLCARLPVPCKTEPLRNEWAHQHGGVLLVLERAVVQHFIDVACPAGMKRVQERRHRGVWVSGAAFHLHAPWCRVQQRTCPASHTCASTPCTTRGRH